MGNVHKKCAIFVFVACATTTVGFVCQRAFMAQINHRCGCTFSVRGVADNMICMDMMCIDPVWLMIILNVTNMICNVPTRLSMPII